MGGKGNVQKKKIRTIYDRVQKVLTVLSPFRFCVNVESLLLFYTKLLWGGLGRFQEHKQKASFWLLQLLSNALCRQEVLDSAFAVIFNAAYPFLFRKKRPLNKKKEEQMTHGRHSCRQERSIKVG